MDWIARTQHVKIGYKYSTTRRKLCFSKHETCGHTWKTHKLGMTQDHD